jgi:DNA-binding CsgD family transcriptional regulator
VPSDVVIHGRQDEPAVTCSDVSAPTAAEVSGEGSTVVPRETVSKILSSVVRVIRDSADLQAAFTAIATAEGHSIDAHYGLHDPRWDQLIVHPGRGLGGRVLEELRPVALDDYFHDTSITGDYRPIVRAENLRALACIPVDVNGRALALLYVAPRSGESVGVKLVDQILHLAELTASCLLHAEVCSNLGAEARRALALDQPTALRSVVRRVATLPQAQRNALGLTVRQLEVLGLLASGMSNAQVALQLGIAEATAKEHVGNLCRKLDASSRLQAVIRGRDAGLV